MATAIPNTSEPQPQNPTPKLSPKEEQDFSYLKHKREVLFARLQRISDTFKSLNADNCHLYQHPFEKLARFDEDLEKIQDDILKFNSSLKYSELGLEVLKVQSAFDSVIDGCRYQYMKFVKPDVTITQRPQDVKFIHTNNLPRIQLPTYDGAIQDWPNFHSLFKSLVHDNNSLSLTEKFQYLRSSLSKDALAVISDFTLAPENYNLAYDTLLERYQNKRLLASMHLNKILQFSPLTSPSYNGLQTYINTHKNVISSLRTLGLPDLNDFILFSLALRNLDPSLRKAFENKISSNVIPTYAQLMEFVVEQSRTQELCNSLNSDKSKVNSQNKVRNVNSLVVPPPNTNFLSNASGSNTNTRPSQRPCFLCSHPHALSQCSSFLKCDVPKKYEILKKNRRCFNCLGAHTRNQCSSSGKCRTCSSQKHHTLLHFERLKKDTTPEPAVPSITPPSQTTTDESQPALTCQFGHINRPMKLVLLGTIRALIQDVHGFYHPVRALLDSGSQVSAISQRLFKLLGLKCFHSDLIINGVDSSSTRPLGTTICKLKSRYSDTELTIQTLIFNTISKPVPSLSLPEHILDAFQHLTLADDKFTLSAPVDLLIGSDYFSNVLLENSQIRPGSPATLDTIFGTVVFGSISPFSSPPPTVGFSVLTLNSQPDFDLRQFWESEEIVKPIPPDPLDLECEDNFKSTHSRTSEGRYIIKLPFHKSFSPLSANRQRSLSSFLSLEKRLARDQLAWESYRKFMQEYLALGHMEVAPSTASYVIPHHCVSKTSSSTTKVRVVFNASSPDNSGISLNDRLLCGPKLQRDISDILISFRKHAVAMCADMKMMYRQILVHPDDRVYQHVFWRPHESSPVLEYQLNTLTYGMKPSAFLAQRVVQQLVHDEGAAFPGAAHALRHHVYIDDVVTGAPDLLQAKQLQSELVSLLAQGGFQLRKWFSNESQLLSEFPNSHLEVPIVFSPDSLCFKVLGLIWSPQKDVFSFQVRPFEGTPTKRSVLSYLAQIFDPLGFLSPVTFWLKYFLQQLWLQRLNWDDNVPSELLSSWENFVSEISFLSSFEIPRPFPQNVTSRLVGFCDASSKGYAAVVYLHHTNLSDELCSVSLLKAKSKVAPLKTITIPKLELCAALLLSKLIKSISMDELSIVSQHFFSDSQIVLSWLSTPPHMLKTFVSNRVVEILENSNPSEWRFLPSEENPADYPSRGLTPSALLDTHSWSQGPPFMTLPFSSWPDFSSKSFFSEGLEQIEEPVALSCLKENSLIDLFSHFSSLLKLQRVMAYALRFKHRYTDRQYKPPATLLLSPKELNEALMACVRATQHWHFSKEISQIRGSNLKSSSLLPLSPLLDAGGILRVGGRLVNSQLPYHSKHPILLPKEAHLSILICDWYHKLTLHSGPSTVQNLIRRRFWIISLRTLLRSRFHSCLVCHKFRAHAPIPKMADLPAARVQLERAFLQVGVDYAGPFSVRETMRRKAPITKGYLCIFVCMATRATHLEVVSDLTTAKFLASLDRFVSRRGLPHVIFSDCGRNFVGAARQLSEFVSFLNINKDSIHSHLSSKQVQWKFNPPSAPHFGGLWEAAVKSAKNLLYRLIGDAPYTFEEYTTLFSRIEAVLNSRPLCANSPGVNDDSDFLSPGHFLIGAPLLAPPELLIEEHLTPVTRWKRLRQMHQAFWKRWSFDYLNCLIQRKKWLRATPSISVGDVVFIKGVHASPTSWPIGRVATLHPGRDNVVRVVSVRTKAGVLMRPVRALVTLPPEQ